MLCNIILNSYDLRFQYDVGKDFRGYEPLKSYFGAITCFFVDNSLCICRHRRGTMRDNNHATMTEQVGVLHRKHWTVYVYTRRIFISLVGY